MMTSPQSSTPPSRSTTLTDPFASEPTPAIPHPWQLKCHPNGALYFYSNELKVVTDEDIRDPQIYQSVMHRSSLYPLSELEDGMEVHLHSSSIEAHSSFNMAINHQLCLASYNLNEIYKLDADERTNNRQRRRYWNYLRSHPAHAPAPKLALQEVVDTLTWYYTDNLISGADSVVPFSKAECEDLLRILKNTTVYSDENSVSRTVFLSWILREITSFRDAEKYGQFTAKQLETFHFSKKPSHPNTIYNHPPFAQTAIRFIINVVFFTIPWTYLGHIKTSSEYRGRLSGVQQNWQAYIERLVREYSDFLLISTVLLSATVGFLTVSDLGSVSKAIAIVSTFTSLGSIIVGVFSIWRHQTNTERSAAFSYMHNARHNPLGFEGHAMLLSLPPVLLVWAIVAFAASILAYVLQNLDTSIQSATAWVVLGVFMLIFVSVSTGLYTFSIIWKWQSPSSRFVRFWSRWRSRQSEKTRISAPHNIAVS